MKLSKDIRSLLVTFLSNRSVVASWGISNIHINENSVCFTVSGMKHHGRESINRREGTVYDVKIGEMLLVSLKKEDVITAIDNYIEHTDNYNEDIAKWLSQKIG